jgi:hypothetical protein
MNQVGAGLALHPAPAHKVIDGYTRDGRLSGWIPAWMIHEPSTANAGKPVFAALGLF